MRRFSLPFFLLALLLSVGAHAFDDPTLAVTAAQYLQSIRDNRNPAGQPAATLTQQAELLARQHNLTAAIERYETALAASAPAAVWLDLSQAWRALAQSSKDSQTQQQARERTRQAAWNALQAARAPFERARALFWLGELYDQIRSPKQAMAAFRAVRPRARLGRYSGEERDAEADIVFASVQTLARNAHLTRFDPRAFDYIVVDEFHHAAAATYRRIIDHFTPDFLLGLTATPDRSDGGDLLGLCEENLVYECDLWSGKLKNARRVATRYDKTAESFLGFIDITSIRLWIRHLST